MAADAAGNLTACGQSMKAVSDVCSPANPAGLAGGEALHKRVD
jgi:hypothetical protein